MPWIVKALDRTTGKPKKLRYDVKTEREAVRLAGEAGYAVVKTKFVPEPPPKTPTPPPVEVKCQPASSQVKGGRVHCPECGSDQISSHKRGYSTGAGAAGCLLLGPLGLIFGASGGNRVMITCLACGHTFEPGAGSR